MQRYFRNGLLILNVCAVLALAGLWVRSTFVADHLKWRLRDQWQITSNWGTLFLFRHENEVFSIQSSYGRTRAQPLGSSSPGRRLLGFYYDHDVGTASPSITTVLGVPFWFLIGLGIVPLAVAFVRFRRDQAIRRLGLCQKCGYDLRATKDRCPECGTVRENLSTAGSDDGSDLKSKSEI